MEADVAEQPYDQLNAGTSPSTVIAPGLRTTGTLTAAAFCIGGLPGTMTLYSWRPSLSTRLVTSGLFAQVFTSAACTGTGSRLKDRKKIRRVKSTICPVALKDLLFSICRIYFIP